MADYGIIWFLAAIAAFFFGMAKGSDKFLDLSLIIFCVLTVASCALTGGLLPAVIAVGIIGVVFLIGRLVKRRVSHIPRE